MVNLPPDPNDRQSRGPLRDNDEAIAITIAFLAIGAILWWGWTRGQRFFLSSPEASGNLLEQPFISEEPLFDVEPSPVAGDRAFEDSEDTSRLLTRREELADGRAIVEADEPEPLDQTSANTRITKRRVGIAPAPRSAATSTDVDSEPETATSDATPSSETTTPPPLDISDVPQDHWAYPFIVSLYEKGLLPDLPEGQLQPDKPMTRAEFAALLNRSFVQSEAGETQLGFVDVSDSYWAVDAIKQVVNTGYMSGFPDNTFKPDELVPRYQVLVTLASGLNLEQPAAPQEVLNRFGGIQDLPNWAFGQVAAAAQNNLVVNHPDPQQLAPQEPATRAEIIVMMYQALLSQGRLNKIESPYVSPGS